MRAEAPVVHSVLDTFVKDLAIVLTEGKKTNTPLFLAAAAHQQFIMASAAGFGREDDAAVVKLWRAYGVDVASAQ